MDDVGCPEPALALARTASTRSCIRAPARVLGRSCVPLHEMHACCSPAITRRQSPPSSSPRLPSLDSAECEPGLVLASEKRGDSVGGTTSNVIERCVLRWPSTTGASSCASASSRRCRRSATSPSTSGRTQPSAGRLPGQGPRGRGRDPLGRGRAGHLRLGSGVGASIAACKLPGVRAAICHDTYSAHQGVEHDDMNVLCIGSGVVGADMAAELSAPFWQRSSTAVSGTAGA